ncbi:EAL domain-containing protein [Pseudomonas sp. QL9]|uniref:EAL domain-containing response regulator n=1 Tax=Pseudomonas sp. QL9 TaxID=3242725 RepID=UPI00352A9E58
MTELRFLVLEDHAFQRVVTVRALQQIGYWDVLQASDGVEALAQLRAGGAVDVALCDLRMIGMDGLMFLRKAGEEGLVRAVVIVSELAPDLLEVVERILLLQGFQLLGSIEKPLRLARLRAVLEGYQSCAKSVDEMVLDRLRRPSLEEILVGLRRQEFRAYFQPKVHLESGESNGAEVLVRWVRDDGSVLSPGAFLPLIARNGLLDVMFAGLLDQGLAMLRLIRSNGRCFRMAFNLDASQMADHGLVSCIRAALERHGLSASGLMFELTEAALIEVPAASLENMVRLRMMGCGLSIDDFGIGYSSLERLCRMPFTEIKLDAGFIRNMVQHDRCRVVVSSALKLAHDLNMAVVAEGIESEEQLNCLKAMGCDVGQGYYYARPMSCVDLMAWLFKGARAACWQV